ncbi:MAG: LolA family protein [Thermodesulfobacteriota bacterium]
MNRETGRASASLKILMVLAAFFYLGPAAAPAGDDPWQGVVDCLRTELGDLKGLSVPYERLIFTSSTMLLGGGEGEDLARGRMHFKPPHFLKIVQEDPREETVVADGETLWWYIPREKQAYRYHAETMGQELKALTDVFRGLRDVEESFEVIWEGHTDRGDRRIRLVPDPPWTQTDSIALEVTTGCRLRVVEIHNAVGNITRFELDPVEEHEAFEEDFFSFTVPEGVRVIDETP